MNEGDTLANALIGAVVSVFAGSIVPFAPLFGGAVAGYLEGGDRSDGFRVGLLSGFIALVPIVFLWFIVVGVIGAFLLGVGPGSGGFSLGVFSLAFLAFGFLFALVYVVGLSAAGGWIGNYVKYDTDIEF